jgi:hypothetical protein
MAKERFKKLRAVGEWGGVLANILVFLGTNWPLTAGVRPLGLVIPLRDEPARPDHHSRGRDRIRRVCRRASTSSAR